MRTLHRLIAAGALAAPLLVAGAGLASADAAYGQQTAVAGPGGAWTHTVVAFADGEGNTYFHEHAAAAGPEGAGSFSTTSWTHDGGYGDGDGYDDGSSAGYHNEEAYASDDGAYYQETFSYADSD
ncbi:hypothetical protein AB0A74_15640 [Saccharothrix sp. NPDC042600]|uniref:hypothetical protein n=1 Tax=Saccharothrix TaxID=2071 RepID=UPI0033F56EE4|nr:hypothetical protein GCM10017745_44920 [Saccharothrix mutabilis subsp. capreolus]